MKHLAPLSALALALLVAPAAEGRSVRNWSGLGVRLGLADIDHLGTTLTAGAHADFGVADNILAVGQLDYWRKSESSGGIETSVRDLALGGMGRFLFSGMNRASTTTPFLEAGLALHMMEADVSLGTDALARSRYSDNDSELGLDLGGGLLFGLMTGSTFTAEIRYRSVSDTDIDHLCFTGGIITTL